MSSRRRIVLATAGHVDHGKTSLVFALTGTDTDRLPDEKRRGISIELGFAELADEGISFIDVPGHRKLVHAMIAGVGGVDGVLLVVAADDGVMPQTREHLHVCALLGLRRVVVALTKADLVDEETLMLAQADVESTLEAMGFSPRALVPCSVVDKRGLDELRAELAKLAADVPPRGESARLWLPIDRVFSIKGAGTVVTGTLTRGSISSGAPLFVARANGIAESSCRGLEIHGHAVERAIAPTRAAVNLARLELADVGRGDVLTSDSGLPISKRLDISLTALPGVERELQSGKPVLVYVGTTRRAARITAIGEGLAHLALDEPMPCQGGVGVVLRGFRARREQGAVLGGGRVLDAGAPALPKKKDTAGWERRRTALAAIEAGDLAGAISGLMAIAAPRPISAAQTERRLGLEPGEVTRALTGKRRKGPADALALPSGDAFATVTGVEALLVEILERLGAYHRAHPDEPGMSLETLRASLAARAGREVTDMTLARATERKKILVAQGIVCLTEFATAQGPQAARVADQVLEVLDRAGLEGVSEPSLLQHLTNERPEAVKSALSRLSTETRARRLSGLWFSEKQLESLRKKVRDHLSSRPSLSVPDFKELAGVSRKQAIPLLEQLDREGTTRRQGDDRVLGARR